VGGKAPAVKPIDLVSSDFLNKFVADHFMVGSNYDEIARYGSGCAWF